MKRKPTEAELEILQILWQHGPSSVRFVHTELSQQRKVVYTTTLKMMQNMAKDGLLNRDTSQRTHVYETEIKQQDVQKNIVNKLVKTLFQGSPLKLALHALGHEKTSAKDLETLKEMIENLEKSDNQ
jgi:predicted transcriptional regulator